MQGTWQWLDTQERKRRQPKTPQPIRVLNGKLGILRYDLTGCWYQTSLKECHQPTKPAPPTKGLHDARNLAAIRHDTCNSRTTACSCCLRVETRARSSVVVSPQQLVSEQWHACKTVFCSSQTIAGGSKSRWHEIVRTSCLEVPWFSARKTARRFKHRSEAH